MAVTGARRHSRRDVLGAAAARAGRRQRPALPGRRRGGRSAARWAPARASGECARAAAASPCITVNAHRLGGFLRLEPDAPRWSTRPPSTFAWARARPAYPSSLSMALVGVGHLVGLSVGMAMFAGIVIGWGILRADADRRRIAGGLGAARGARASFAPTCASSAPASSASPRSGPSAASSGRSSAGCAPRCTRPRASAAGAELPLVERDLPIKVVGGVVAVTLALIAVLLWQFIAGGPLAAHALPLIAATVVFVLVAGVVIASICGYMAGLIGASNSPVSGVGILAVIAAALMLIGRRRARRRRPATSSAHGRLRAVRDRHRVRHRDHLQRQPAGPEDRSAGRRDAVAAAGGAGRSA